MRQSTALESARRTLLAAAVLVALGGAAPAGAASFTVTSAADSGPGTLRQAMLDANASTGPHTIGFALRLGTTIGLTSGQIELVDGNVSIVGPGRDWLAISGSHLSRIFHVKAGVLSVSGVTLRDGHAVGDDSNDRDNRGGAIQVGEPASPPPGEAPPPGTILPGLNLRDVAIVDNEAWSPRDGGGGGVFSQAGDVTVDHCLFQRNYSRRAGGGLQARFGSLDVRDSQFLDNTLSYSPRERNAEGGGIEINGAHAVIVRSIIRGNHETGTADEFGVGAGISIDMHTEPVLIQDSEVSDNDSSVFAVSFGAGVHCREEEDGPTPTLTLLNSTVSGNVGLSGGIEAGCNMALLNSTVTNNATSNYDYGIPAGVEPYSPQPNTVTRLTIVSSIVAGNRGGPDLQRYLYAGYPDPIVTGGNALIQTAEPAIPPMPRTIYGVDPLLGPLADNGGATRTHALLPGSPALDSGTNTRAMLFDQRGPGHPRKIGRAVDIGAYEARPGGS